MKSKPDEYYMRQALRLAAQAVGLTNPNPLVGAVIVKKGKIIGQGYHLKAGDAHAEINALKAATEDPEGATLYVNLEPCSHFGKTPPCVDALIKAKIKQVVCAMKDVNPLVRGKGISKLRKAGIKVEVGVLKEEAEKLNETFVVFHKNKRPFIALKFAASLDGKIATRTGDSKWLTNSQARAHARGLRARYQSVLVGINTVIADNPHLGVREQGKKDPLRIILDSKLRIAKDAKVLRDRNVLLVTTTQADKEKLRWLKKAGFEVKVYKNHISVKQLLKDLYKKEIISVLVEGGGTVNGSFVDNKLVDKVYVYQAPLLVGGKNSISAVEGVGAARISQALSLKVALRKVIGNAFFLEAYPARVSC